jgi:hypothetical protein
MLHQNRINFMLGPIFGLVATALLTACGAGDSPNGSSPDPSTASTTVQVSVKATDPDGDQLHYRWAVTEGRIDNKDARTTTWTVPRGSGFQFVYVVVSDGKGGYTEQRAAGLTFDPAPVTSTTAPVLTPPAPTGAAGFVWGSVYSADFNRNVYLPGVKVTLQNGKSAVTDMKGQFFIPSVPDGQYNVTYQIPGISTPIGGNPITVSSSNLPTSPSAGSYISQAVKFPNNTQVAGSVRLADRTFCGIRDEFFTHSSASNLFREPVSGSAQLLNDQDQPLSVPVPINHYGDFLLLQTEPGTRGKVRISCEVQEDSPSFSLNGSIIKVPSTIVLKNSRPIVESPIVKSEADSRPDLPRPRTLFESVNKTPPTFGDEDLIAEIIHTPGDDAFFTYKGIDTRKSACAYYKAIGAVEGCDADGFPTGAQLTLAQWRNKFTLSTIPNSTTKIPPDPDDGQEIRLQYVNSSDLNLGRDMQAIKLADGTLAYNTCNYPGSQDVTNIKGAPKEIGAETQPDIDLAISNIRKGIGLIVCVAMDDSSIPGINGGNPFTKFYTFGPTGKLLLSVSLDGRREKFMPGTCTTCHGGDAYGGQFPDDGSGRPDLISRWQPFDMANLKVRLSSDQDRDDANKVVKAFNKRLLDSKIVNSITTPRTRDLITNWYNGGRLDQDPTFIPPQSPTKDLNLYRKVIQPGCQTCHAAQTPNGTETLSKKHVCGGDRDLEQNHTMTNTLVPFERFWLDPTIPPLLNLGCNDKPLKHPSL